VVARPASVRASGVGKLVRARMADPGIYTGIEI